jgi:hypothetical protein
MIRVHHPAARPAAAGRVETPALIQLHQEKLALGD